jgi:hypothetical protein
LGKGQEEGLQLLGLRRRGGQHCSAALRNGQVWSIARQSNTRH